MYRYLYFGGFWNFGNYLFLGLIEYCILLFLFLFYFEKSYILGSFHLFLRKASKNCLYQYFSDAFILELSDLCSYQQFI